MQQVIYFSTTKMFLVSHMVFIINGVPPSEELNVINLQWFIFIDSYELWIHRE